VSTFFNSFGVNVLSLLYYLLLFGIVLYLLRRYAFSVILRTIDARQDKINKSLDEAQEAAASVKTSQAKAEKTIDEAAAEAREIITRAERLAAEIHEDARKEAKVQADLIVFKAREEIDRERQAAVNDLRRAAVDLALTAAGRVIGENLSDDKSRQLAEEAVKQAELRA
jgi:F-type H+-transporting ATPase subunit b